MKKHQVRCGYLTFLFILFYSIGHSQNQTQGLIEYSASRIKFDEDKNIENIIWHEWNRIWFKDSCIVYELRINLETRDQTKEGMVVKKSYPVLKYIYLDLRTMICQDYHNFNDSALPFCNYFLKSNDKIGFWNFFTPKIPWDTTEKITPLPDTIINKSLFKRIKVTYPFQDYSTVYYLDYNPLQNMFHFNRTLDEMFSCCKATRVDELSKNGNVTGRTEFKIKRNSLSAEENNIFKQWHENAKGIKLPLSSYDEATKSCMPFPEHENPTITIIPNSR